MTRNNTDIDPRLTEPWRRRLVPAVSGGALSEVAARQSVRPRQRERSDGLLLAGRAVRLNLESLLYVVIGLLAVITRFWDLSSRALHHDESLHAYYSWLYATGQGYVHDPLMHGPSLFHSYALTYFLFGDNDF